MKTKRLTTLLLCIILSASIALISVINAFAVDEDGDGIDDDIVQAETYEPIDPIEPTYDDTPVETQPQTENIPPETDYYEPDTEYFEPQTEEPQNEPQTDYIEPNPQENTQEAYGNIYDEDQTTEFQAPTLAKTISNKRYSTSNTAGIVAWFCVIMGALVLFVVLLSTKISGIKEKRRKSYNGYYERS